MSSSSSSVLSVRLRPTFLSVAPLRNRETHRVSVVRGTEQSGFSLTNSRMLEHSPASMAARHFSAHSCEIGVCCREERVLLAVAVVSGGITILNASPSRSRSSLSSCAGCDARSTGEFGTAPTIEDADSEVGRSVIIGVEVDVVVVVGVVVVVVAASGGFD